MRCLLNCNSRDNIKFMDIGSSFLDDNGMMLPDLTVDSLHPNEKGYGIWAAVIVPV